MGRARAPEVALTVLAVACGIISIACCGAAVNVSAPVAYEGADIAAAAAAAGQDKRDQDLLHWAIKHSDPDKLQEAAAALKDPAVLAARTPARQKEMQDVLEAMRQEPSEAELMRAAIAELTASNATETDKLDALHRLRDLIRPINNANDLKGVGGIEPLLAALNSSSGDVRAAAAGVLGTAASNNVRVQQDVADVCPDIVQKLLLVLQSNHTEAAAKGPLFALGNFLRNSAQQQDGFVGQGGMDTLQNLFTDDSVSETLRQKILDLIGDLARGGLQKEPTPEFLEAVVKMLNSALPDDWPALEGALQAASVLASALPQAGAQLLASGLRKSLDAVRSALSKGAAHGDEDDWAFAQELLQLVEQVGRQASGAAGRVAASAAGGCAAPSGGAAADAAADGGDAEASEQQEVVMLGPARGAGEKSSGHSAEEL